MERVAAPTDVTFAADTVGGIPGLWAKPAQPRKGAAILHVHGGWFNLGTARAYRNFGTRDRKSTRLNSSHGYISYAVFCLKKKKTKPTARRFSSCCSGLSRCTGLHRATLVATPSAALRTKPRIAVGPSVRREGPAPSAAY